ncbi:MAG: energy-coupling factor transporter transmembrane component T [Bacillota bacterium]
MAGIHPLTIIIMSFILLFITLAYSHPLFIVSILAFLTVSIIVSGHIKELKGTVKALFCTALMIIVINPLVSGEGITVIYSSPRIPVLGKVRITAEAFAYGCSMALKLICIMLVFLFYSVLTDRDDAFSFVSRHAHKLTLVLSMTTNIIHRLHLEIKRVKDVMTLRGVKFNDKSLIKRARAHYPVLKVILISSLEGSLDRAEALYSRAYGRQRRTSYSRARMNGTDFALTAVSVLLACTCVFGLFSGIGQYSFYPALGRFEGKDMAFIAVADAILLVILLLIRRCIRWRHLKSSN